MHGESPESVRTFTVDPAYRRLWLRRGTVCLVVGASLAVIGVVLFAVGVPSPAAFSATLGVLLLLVGALIRAGGSVTQKKAYQLEVGPEGLTVVWRDQVTPLPWARLEYTKVTKNGPWSVDLEARPRPEFSPVLPRNASPRPSKRTPGLLHVFSLNILGPAQADCLAEVERYIQVR